MRVLALVAFDRDDAVADRTASGRALNAEVLHHRSAFLVALAAALSATFIGQLASLAFRQPLMGYLLGLEARATHHSFLLFRERAKTTPDLLAVWCYEAVAASSW